MLYFKLIGIRAQGGESVCGCTPCRCAVRVTVAAVQPLRPRLRGSAPSDPLHKPPFLQRSSVLHPPSANGKGHLHRLLSGTAGAASLLPDVCLPLKVSCSPRRPHRSSSSEEARVEEDQQQMQYIQRIPVKPLKMPLPEEVHVPEGIDFSRVTPKWKGGK